MKKTKTIRKRKTGAAKRSAKLSLAEIEECLVHLNMVVPGLDRLGSAEFKSQREEFLAQLDYMEWTRLFRRLAQVRWILDIAYDRAVSKKRVSAFHDRIDKMPEWRFNAAAKKRMRVLAATWRKEAPYR